MFKKSVAVVASICVAFVMSGCVPSEPRACVEGIQILDEYRTAMASALDEDVSNPEESTELAKQKLSELQEIAEINNDPSLSALVSAENEMVEITEALNNDEWPGQEKIDEASSTSLAANEAFVGSCE